MGNGIISRYKSNYKNNNTTVTRTSKICIPYDKWIQNDCKKWGHYKEFSLTYLNETLCSSPVPALTAASSSSSASAINTFSILNSNYHHQSIQSLYNNNSGDQA